MNLQQPLTAESSVSASSSRQLSGDFKSPVLPSTTKKRPGPKRDSKPAPSEKLERNRQAQRTHRERKEQYTKDLELELSRLRELFVTTAQERDAAHQARDEALAARDLVLEENRRLKEIIQMSSSAAASSNTSGTDSGLGGFDFEVPTRNCSFSTAGGFPSIPPQVPIGQQQQMVPQLNIWESSETRGFASDGPALEPTRIKVEGESSSRESSAQTVMPSQQEIDYDELGLDFVLTLERPCMGHLQYLTVRAHNCPTPEMPGQPMEVPDDGENQHISGHALMATAPPYSHIQNSPHERYPTELPQVQREDLMRLLNLSNQLQEVTEKELPPVKAWIRVMQDERFGRLSRGDLERLKGVLEKKVHCYRFGAVLEERDIAEALQEVLGDQKGE